MPENETTIQRAETNGNGWGVKAVVFAAIVIVAGGVYYNFRDQLSLAALANHEAQLVKYGESHPLLIVVLAFVVYVSVTGLSLPGAAVLTLAIGWLFKLLFGPGWGYAIALTTISFASTSGATIAFVMSRYLFRDFVQSKFSERLEKFNEALEREGAFYLFSLRLIPAVPFFVINVVMGLTPMKVWTFWWVSQVGMLIGTAVYVYAGWSVPSAQQLAEEGVSIPWQVLVGFVLLGLFPLVAKKVMHRIRPQETDADENENEEHNS